MDQPVLSDPSVFPDHEVLEGFLGRNFSRYERLAEYSTAGGLTLDWHYYRDGKSWLCKAQFKKKTVFWLSVWQAYFKTSFYFTEKHKEEIQALAINPDLLTTFLEAKPAGKLIPLVITVDREERLPDVFRLIEYKKGLK